MSEKEKEIIRKVAHALPEMSDMDKGYFFRIRRSDGVQENGRRSRAE